MLRQTTTLISTCFALPTATQLARITFIASAKRYRYFSSDTNATHLKYVPHAFSAAKAAELIAEHDKSRLFAPFKKPSTNLVISEGNPLKAVLIPTAGINAYIESAYYEGQIGRDRTEVVTTTDEKGNTHYSTRTVTDWTYTRGTMGSCHYRQSDPNMVIYFGDQYNDQIAEETVEGYAVQSFLKPFDVSQISQDISIDPWKKVDALGITVATQRIRSQEGSRASQHIKDNNWDVDHTQVDHLVIRYRILADGRKDFFLEAMMLPIYTIEYPLRPTRMISAISATHTKIAGPAPISDIKVMAATTTATAIISLLFPQIAVPARVLSIVTAAIASGTWTHLWPSIRGYLDKRRVDEQKNFNAQFSRSYIDDTRLDATTREHPALPQSSSQLLEVDEKFYKILGLDPSQVITDEMIQDAFTKRLKLVHSDLSGGNDKETIQLIEARNVFRAALQNHSLHSIGKRHFSTYIGKKSPLPTPRQVEVLLKEPPRSSPHPNGGYLIKLVLEEKNYDKALTLITRGELHVDGHDNQENTLLTEAVKRKDIAGVRFALKKARCSVDLSCDCPLHNTAMHYWAEGAGSNNGRHRNAEIEIFHLLIEHNARINLINSAGQTPLDMASTDFAKNQLISQGAVRHSTQDGIAGFLAQMRGRLFSYPPSKRTMVIEQQIRDDKLLTPSSNESKKLRN